MRFPAISRVCSTESAAQLATSTTLSSVIRSTVCRRERSTISLTSVVRRSASTFIRREKRFTAAGSSAAPSTASANSDNPPTGVLSS